MIAQSINTNPPNLNVHRLNELLQGSLATNTKAIAHFKSDYSCQQSSL